MKKRIRLIVLISIMCAIFSACAKNEHNISENDGLLDSDNVEEINEQAGAENQERLDDDETITQDTSGRVEFTVNSNGENEVRIYYQGIEELLLQDDFQSLRINLFSDRQKYEDSFNMDCMFIDYCFNEGEENHYYAIIGYHEPQPEYGEYCYEEKGFSDEYGSIIYFPVNMTADYVAVKCNIDAANDMLSSQNYYELIHERNLKPGEVSDAGTTILFSGAIKDAGVSTTVAGNYTVLEEYQKTTDGDFFKPVTEYYRVYSIDYPVAIVGDWGWYLWTDEIWSPGPVELGPYEAYGPLDPRETTCTLTYIESVNEFGELVQYVARVSFPNEDDVLLAWATDKPYFPYSYNGKNEMSLEGFPDDFVHNDMMKALETQSLNDALQYYEQGNAYFDLLACLEKENAGGVSEKNLSSNHRYPVVMTPTCGLGRISYVDDVGIMDELDREGQINTLLTYYMEVELDDGRQFATTDIQAIFTGYTSKDYASKKIWIE